MDDADRFRLLGKYKTPRFRIGQRVLCEVRGEVVITGMTEAPIPWPLGLRVRGRHTLIVYKDLAKALRRESNQAICHWWGITPQTVSKWRKLLGIERATPGTFRLQSEYAFEPACVEGRRKAHAKAGDPERRAKIAAARRGKPRPPHVLEAMHAARRGSRHSKETREQMRQAHRRRGTLVPGTRIWTPEEDEMVRTLAVEEATRRTGRTLGAVYARRARLRLPDGRRRG